MQILSLGDSWETVCMKCHILKYFSWSNFLGNIRKLDWTLHFMQIVFLGDNLHDFQILFCRKNMKYEYFKMLSAEFAHSMVSVNPCHADWIKMRHPLPIFSQSDCLIQGVDKIHILNEKQCRSRIVASEASSEANWSGSTLFAKAGHSHVQQDKDLNFSEKRHVMAFKSHSSR